ncbi:MAG: FGGY-family carbohydrate kinase [Oscillospiraceae bacterium]|nr:FGGY-family carbohydrate kinase [Oscillospiraceae bacterium]
MDKYVISIDCGSQSFRAMIFNEFGECLFYAKEEFEPYFALKPEYAEQNADFYWEVICRILKDLKEKAGEIWEKVIGVSFATMRDTVVALDKDHKPIRPVFVWPDQRMAECNNKIPAIENAGFKAIGMKYALEVSRRKSKANWMIENEPELWAKVDKYCVISTYFNYKLTGKVIDSVATQIGHIPFDYKNLNWPKNFMWFRWNMWGVKKYMLTELTQCGETLGYVTKEASLETGLKEGLPVVAGGSDKACETLGVGARDESFASLSFGTQSTIQVTSPKYLEPIAFLPSYPAVIRGYYNPEIGLWRGYWMISWYKKEFGNLDIEEAKRLGTSAEEVLDKGLSNIPPGCAGLMLQPYWGPGLKTPMAKGAIIGFGDIHTRHHIYRAIIEGINFALMDGLGLIEKKTNVKVTRIGVSGGGANSDEICQITSNMFGVEVVRERTVETSGLGAAINSFVGLKVYDDYESAIKNMVKYEKIFKPEEDEMKLYQELFNKVYKNIYPRLSKLYKEIQNITKYPVIYG